MKNHFIDTLRWAGLSLAAVAMAALTACTNEDNATEPSAGARTYTVCIPASLNEGAQTRAVSFSKTECTSTFKTSEKVYVYNATKGKMLLNGDGSDLGCLHPASISDDGTKCSLEGTLTGNIAAGDVLTLFYNMNGYGSTLEENSYYYGYQDGTADGALDGAMATVTVSNYSGGTLTTTATASFTNLQSMFRFQFQDEGSSAITVKGLKIESKNNALPSIYYPLKSGAEQYYTDYISVIPATATSDYLYVALCIDESKSAGDELTFTVTDSDDKVYQGSKDAPTAGFKNGNYYYNTAPIALTYQYQLQKPTITWTKCDYDPEPNPVDFFWTVKGTWNDALDDYNDDIDFTLSGTSYGYSFSMDNAGTVRLNGLNATMVNNNFIQCNGGDLTVDITGANTITCKDVSNCISASQNLKLSGSGTLTVTAGEYYCGLWGNNNYTDANNSYETTTAADVSAQLAADGHTVTRSARTDNADGTYTWTYTVEPIPLAVKHAGESTYTAVTGDIELANGDVLTGMLDGATQKYKVSIADGATVTLRNATINGEDDGISSHTWAGLTCLGDATIILEGTNAVENFNRHYPGLQPGPTGTTLTIRGSGKLTATGSSSGAGIGTKYDGGSCGNIRIEGGTITATGGNNSAGIGSSYNSTCGDIIITGGTITATGGYFNGAGIGSGYGYDGTSQCGKIEISGSAQVTATGGINAAGIGSGSGYGEYGTSKSGNIEISGSVQVTANGGEQAAGIGTGAYGTCGNISISGGTVTANGGEKAAGIGTGYGEKQKKAVCGDITITWSEGFVSVTAIRGSGAVRSIGPAGNDNDYYGCGSVSFNGQKIHEAGEELSNFQVPDNDSNYNELHFTISTTNVPDGEDPEDEKYKNNTWTLTP